KKINQKRFILRELFLLRELLVVKRDEHVSVSLQIFFTFIFDLSANFLHFQLRRLRVELNGNCRLGI
ncbi:unnamed protein product, partial [Arabidopsis halleri]